MSRRVLMVEVHGHFTEEIDDDDDRPAEEIIAQTTSSFWSNPAATFACSESYSVGVDVVDNTPDPEQPTIPGLEVV